MNSPRSIRARFPVTASDIHFRGTTKKLFLTLHPPAYQSKRGRVKRWPASIINLTNNSRTAYCAIIGTAASLDIIAVTARTNPNRIRAFGTYLQMKTVLSAALKNWQSLPGGQEIETMMARMFPAEIQLEADETIDKTKS